MSIKSCPKCHSQLDAMGQHYQMTFCVKMELKKKTERIELLEDALRDLLNDVINFNGSELSDCILLQAQDLLKLNGK